MNPLRIVFFILLSFKEEEKKNLPTWDNKVLLNLFLNSERP